MQHMRIETRIEAPVEEVWEFYCDTPNWPDFMPRATFSDFSGPIDKVGIVESDYEMPGRVLGVFKDMVSKGWAERNMRNSMADFKALVEAKVPAKA